VDIEALLRALLLALLGTLASTGGEPSPGSPPAQAKPLVLLALLLDPGAKAPDCGVLHVAVVMKYEVVQVLEGDYGFKHLYAAHGCPELSRQSYMGPEGGDLQAFRRHDVHRLVLRPGPPPPGVGPALDHFGDAALPRFFVTRADLVRGGDPR
jgi:hypothetical protein